LDQELFTNFWFVINTNTRGGLERRERERRCALLPSALISLLLYHIRA
jgi:hypothetical protein